MSSKLSRERQQQKKIQKRIRQTIWLVVCGGLFIAATVTSLLFQSKRVGDRKAWDESTEGRLLQSASPIRINQRYRPVLIYRYRGTNRAAFTAVGTMFEGKNGPLVATIEHLLQKKFENELFVLRFLSPDLHQATNGIQSIAYRNSDAGLPKDTDVVFVRPGDPRQIECFSEKTENIAQTATVYLFDNVQVGGRVVKKLKSLVTGKEYLVIGASKDPQFILIKYASQAGESGSGFIDEYGQLYVLSGGTRGGTNPVSFLSGPFANLEKRL